MSDDLEKKTDADRLQELKAELSRHFGRFTRWRALCQERDVTIVEGQLRLAEEVLEVRPWDWTSTIVNTGPPRSTLRCPSADAGPSRLSSRPRSFSKCSPA